MPDYSLVEIIDKLYVSDIYSPLMENSQEDIENDNTF